MSTPEEDDRGRVGAASTGFIWVAALGLLPVISRNTQELAGSILVLWFLVGPFVSWFVSSFAIRLWIKLFPDAEERLYALVPPIAWHLKPDKWVLGGYLHVLPLVYIQEIRPYIPDWYVTAFWLYVLASIVWLNSRTVRVWYARRKYPSAFTEEK